MEFWGAEVKAGETVKVDPFEFDAAIHLSQATIGESKKDKTNETVVIYVKVGDQKFVLGNLIRDKIPQISFDLVFDRDFELSHNSKTSSVHFLGYKALFPEESEDEFTDEDDEEEEDIPLTENGKLEAKAEEPKVTASKKSNATSAKQVKVVDPKEDKDEDSEDSDDDEIDSSDDEEIEDADDSDSEDADESDEDDEEETPTPVKKGQKRPNESDSKTPVSTKKAKTATPEKTDGKKAPHTATPHPKKGGKTPNNDAKSPKSGGQLSCGSCSKTFNSDAGLQQHSKAKHGAK